MKTILKSMVLSNVSSLVACGGGGVDGSSSDSDPVVRRGPGGVHGTGGAGGGGGSSGQGSSCPPQPPVAFDAALCLCHDFQTSGSVYTRGAPGARATVGVNGASYVSGSTEI